MSAVWRADLPAQKRLAVWHCERCADAACEVSAEGDPGTPACPFGREAEWRRG